MSSGIVIRALTGRDDPSFEQAAACVATAFYNPKHTVLSSHSVVGGRYDLWPYLSRGMVGSCALNGGVFVAIEREEGGSEQVVGVICWDGPGLQPRFEDDPDWKTFVSKGREDPRWIDWFEGKYKDTYAAFAAVSVPSGADSLERYCIEVLGVRPTHHRRGIGSKLINTVVDLVRKEKNPEAAVVWVVTSEGTRAYESCGFKVTSSLFMPSPWGDFKYDALAWKRNP
ncbi:hypothetical protein M422DRAFT_70926 [Sphaerobolus stellatus SS14]|uniref:N-acetyltransferase domain-containing protein n=1 Tax=Sphaerobolus stellatus (strain SS14) TaxID=990650 RepID=A0A0C9V0U9_SPHS4|nr:hypothetical protein M422DRAFT_70926 [Sphaerobolus stellatus SS14]